MDEAKRSDETTRTQALKDLYAKKKDTGKERAQKADEKTGTFKIVTDRDSQVNFIPPGDLARLITDYSSTRTLRTTRRTASRSACSRLRIWPTVDASGGRPHSTSSTTSIQQSPADITRKHNRALALATSSRLLWPLHGERFRTPPDLPTRA